MKYFSEKLNQLFDAEEDLKQAEQEQEDKEIEKQKLAETKKARAAEVEDAYKATIEAREDASNLIKAADDKYFELRDKFIEDFGSYHMTYTTRDGQTQFTISDAIDNMFDIFKNFPFLGF